VRHLPVTTEIAKKAGVDFAGYPKIIADIDFGQDGDWVSCEARADDQHILTLRGRKLPLKRAPRSRIHPINCRRGYLLRSEFVISEREAGVSTSGQDVKLELGAHPIAQELGEIKPGKVLGYRYCPQAQGILTPVFESFAADKIPR
jgi:hypothetical protein